MGHGLGCDVKGESEQGVTGVAPGKTVPTGGVCHAPIIGPLSQPFTSTLFTMDCRNIYLGVPPCNPNMTLEKNKKWQ